MLRVLLPVALLLTAVPLAEAGPSDLCDVVGDTVGCGAEWLVPAQPVLRQMEVVIDELCQYENSPQCRYVSGRPGFDGAGDICGLQSPHGLPGGLAWHAVNGGTWMGVPLPTGADPAVENATTFALAGTPLEGESICHDHRPTLRALATLP